MKTVAEANVRPLLGKAYSRATGRVRLLTPIQRAARDAILRDDSAADYEEVACLCGASEALPLAELERHGLAYHKLICTSCGLLRVSPRWTEQRYQRFYEHEYRDLYNPLLSSKEQYASDLARGSRHKDVTDWIVSANTRFRPGAARTTIVEIGAGGGWNLASLPAQWQRIGYDVDREYLELGSQLFGCTMKYGLADAALADIVSADLVLLSHVVEHFTQPAEVLSSIAAALPPNGLLCIEVPGIFRIHRSNLDVMSYMQNAHTYTFCAATMGALCARAGLEVLAIDETVRVVCRRAARPAGPPLAPADRQLSARIIAYLQRCERGYNSLATIKRLPKVGHYLAAIWRRLYFPLVGIAATSIRGRVSTRDE